jgi:NAD(P)H-quinone oxidoreductase subunit 5
LVSFLGAVVIRFSSRYLEGDPARGHFLKWLGVTLGSVLGLILSGNLLFFSLCWIATSLSLHRLLLFYPNRAGARRAARKKFVISRLADVCVLTASVLLFHTFNSVEFSEIFALAGHLSPETVSPSASWAAFLLVLAAMLKSAQFPFHSWLPDTLETPTPVSALMHAGIINGGGYLILRLSPVLVLTPSALTVLAIGGTVTAALASLVMLTQTSIKKSLAWSTVSQMGFMMLQCGLGAFTLAALHLVSHSLYKAHAFLSSGRLLISSNATRFDTDARRTSPALLLGLIIALGGLGTAAIPFLPDSVRNEPGFIVLGSVLLLSLVQLLGSAGTGRLSFFVLFSGLGLAALVIATTTALHLGFHQIFAGVFPTLAKSHDLLILSLAGVFLLVLIFQALLPLWLTQPWCARLYVHLHNGYYVNTRANLFLKKVWPTNQPPQPNA